MKELSAEQTRTLKEALRDYIKMMDVGLCLRYPLEAERAEFRRDLNAILTFLTPTEEALSGDTKGHTSGLDNPARRIQPERDGSGGYRESDRGHSSEGANTADRGLPPAGRTVQTEMGSETDAGTSADEQADDSGDGTPGR